MYEYAESYDEETGVAVGSEFVDAMTVVATEWASGYEPEEAEEVTSAGTLTTNPAEAENESTTATTTVRVGWTFVPTLQYQGARSFSGTESIVVAANV